MDVFKQEVRYLCQSMHNIVNMEDIERVLQSRGSVRRGVSRDAITA